ncbi:uncharacterized protein LOC103500458 isoform X2 [Cucumis melo]|uniref:Protein HGH1 homolog n=1 Tax=Cucumis melo TaxID=3656 RepID=A0A1S3CFY2_CUCME|nr:uncharacterized protein LOC103500458 isoform X2 [Cucumis melo]
MATELEELIQFLSSPSPQLRKAAIDIVQGLTGSEDGLQSLAKYPDVLLPSLARLLREQKDVAERAAEALVNLSQNSDLAGKMIDLGLIGEAMNLLYNVDSSISQLLVMLLVNLTQLDAGIASLLQTGDDKMQGLYVMKIVRSFCRSASESSDDPFEHVASILVNISKKEAGRKLLLDPNRGLLKQIIRQYDSNSQLRKNGVYKEEDTSKMPLELGTALSIEREQIDDPEIRVHALEAIYMIILQDAGRRAFWSINGPRILQVGYEDEENPKVMEAYERVGSLLVNSGGDEEPHD